MDAPKTLDSQDPLGPKIAPKRVDEEWKRKAREETRKVEQTTAGAASAPGEKPAPAPSPHFMELVVGLSTQTALQLRQGQLEQAEFSIGILQSLKDKTRGNLAAEEQKMLDRSLYELQMQYMQFVKGAAQKGSRSDAGTE